jgi:hypothetical protein
VGVVTLFASVIAHIFDKGVGALTATSTVFSCPTRLISDVHVLRVMTAAMKTYPLLFVALEAVICAPSGDQL